MSPLWRQVPCLCWGRAPGSTGEHCGGREAHSGATEWGCFPEKAPVGAWPACWEQRRFLQGGQGSSDGGVLEVLARRPWLHPTPTQASVGGPAAAGGAGRLLGRAGTEPQGDEKQKKAESPGPAPPPSQGSRPPRGSSPEPWSLSAERMLWKVGPPEVSHTSCRTPTPTQPGPWASCPALPPALWGQWALPGSPLCDDPPRPPLSPLQRSCLNQPRSPLPQGPDHQGEFPKEAVA